MDELTRLAAIAKTVAPEDRAHDEPHIAPRKGWGRVADPLGSYRPDPAADELRRDLLDTLGDLSPRAREIVGGYLAAVRNDRDEPARAEWFVVGATKRTADAVAGMYRPDEAPAKPDAARDPALIATFAGYLPGVAAEVAEAAACRLASRVARGPGRETIPRARMVDDRLTAAEGAWLPTMQVGPDGDLTKRAEALIGTLERPRLLSEVDPRDRRTGPWQYVSADMLRNIERAMKRTPAAEVWYRVQVPNRGPETRWEPRPPIHSDCWTAGPCSGRCPVRRNPFRPLPREDIALAQRWVEDRPEQSLPGSTVGTARPRYLPPDTPAGFDRYGLGRP